MTRSFSSLERVLTLEAQQGYQDKAVVGGIRQFAAFWVGQAREEAQDEADKALVEQVAEVLTSYGKLHGVDARQKAVDGLLASLERRQKRLADTSTKQEAPRPKQTADRPQKAPPPPKKEVVITSREEEESPEELFDEEAEFDESAEEPVKKSVEESAEESVEEPSIEVEPDIEGLKQPVTILKGVGPKIARKLEKLGAWTIYDLLYLFPRRYDDYTLMKPINRLNYGEQVTVIGTIWQTRAKRIRGNQTLVQAVVNDGTGSVQATWYNQPWLTKQLPAGMQIVLSGKVDQFLGRPVFNSPEWEPLELEPLRTRRIVPIYPLTEGLGSHRMREIMDAAVSYWSMRVPDALPESLRRQLKLYKLPQALKQIHFPDNQESLQKARKRLA
ncbi:MAG: OB-fold nucleic acid binding domain-containing protein, partial [Candidatus Promineifilaceae bacterium]